MNFQNNHPFSVLYRDLLEKTYLDYLSQKQKTDYKVLSLLAPYQPKSTINNLIDQESAAIKDQLNLSANAIKDRLKLNHEFKYCMTYHWLYTKDRIDEISVNFYSQNSGRRIANLESQLVNIDRTILEQKIEAWKDVVPEMEKFITLFHKHNELKADQELIRT